MKFLDKSVNSQNPFTDSHNILGIGEPFFHEQSGCVSRFRSHATEKLQKQVSGFMLRRACKIQVHTVQHPHILSR